MGAPFCPVLTNTFILPKRVSLVPQRSMKVGDNTVKVDGALALVPVQTSGSGLSLDQIKSGKGKLSLPQSEAVPVPIPLVPLRGYVEYETEDGQVTADAEDGDYKVVTVSPACQGDACAWWNGAKGHCGAIN